MLLHIVASQGAYKGFYQGRIAESIVQAVQEYDGLLTVEDLQKHRTRVEDEPISAVYKG